MIPEFTLAKAKLFQITDQTAKEFRLICLKEQIQNLEIEVQNYLKLWWSEQHLVGQELIEDNLVKFWKLLDPLYRELEAWPKPAKQYDAKYSIDWQKASEYPCTDLLGQPAKKMGQEWLYHAPNREDRKPSFSVSISKNIWHDWATGQGGNVFDLYILLNGGSKVQAAKSLLNL